MYMPWCLAPGDRLPLNSSFHSCLCRFMLTCRSRGSRGASIERRRRGGRRYAFTIMYMILVLFSFFIFLLYKESLRHFFITCTFKDSRTTWHCLVEGYLASLHDLVSFQIEHTICSRVVSIAKKYTINRSGLKFIQHSFLQNKTFATKDSKVTHPRSTPMH